MYGAFGVASPFMPAFFEWRGLASEQLGLPFAQHMMAACGDPETVAMKRRVMQAVRAGEPPLEMAGNRHGRAGIRIALRQMKAEGLTSPALTAWLASLDQGSLDDNDDEALQHG